MRRELEHSVQRVVPIVLATATALLGGALPAAQGADRSGQQVVDSQCITCHGSGAKGAPRIGDTKAWAGLASRGLASLTANALTGIRQMPAHGGNPGLSDTEIERAITTMVNRSGGHWTESISHTAPAPERSGKQVVDQRCSKCHEKGDGGAPRIGDKAAWTPRLSHGLDQAVRSAIHGHGGMPPRGGMADLSDAEVKNAVIYMFNPASATTP